MNLDLRLLRLARSYRAGYLFTIALGLLGGGLVVWQSWLLSSIIGRVFLKGETLRQVGAPLCIMVVLICLRGINVWGAEALAELTTVRLKMDLRNQMVKHLLALGPGFARLTDRQTEKRGQGEFVFAALEGVEGLHAYFSRYLPQIALSALVPLTLLFFILPIDRLSALILFLTAPLIPLFMILIGSSAETLTRRQWLLLSRLGGYFHDLVIGLTTLKTLGQSRGQAGNIKDVSERYRRITMQVLRVTFLSAFSLELIATLSTAVIAVEIGLRLLYGRLEFEQALFVLVLAPEFYLPLRTLGARFHAGMSGVAAARRIFGILEMPVQQTFAAIAKKPFRGASPQSPAEISFEQVSYTYPDGRQAIRGVSFSLQPGKMVALVGPSGSGKSTLASLLLGFMGPQKGRILVAGESLRDWTAEDWYARVAWVPQKPYLFHDTIAANIRLMHPEASDEQVEAAARLAQAHEFIIGFPQGYETQVGEQGARLSAGQAQRIALARAFLKDTPVLVLDEPTAYLDPENETAIRQALEHLVAGRTTLVIAHRLETVTRADQILVLENGQIRERGTHVVLSRQGELYPQFLAAYQGMLDSGFDYQPPGLLTRSSAQIRGIPSPEPPFISLGFEELAGDAPDRWGKSMQRLLAILAPFRGWMAVAAILGFLTIGSGVGLIATSAYIISAAALHPSIAVLQVPIVGVRFFGLARAVSRYLERYTTHQVTLRILSRLRVWFYQALEPLAPARLISRRSGDLLGRITVDIATLEDFFVRALAPPLVAFLTAVAMPVFLSLFNWQLALAGLAFYCLAGLGVPTLIRKLSRITGCQLVENRTEFKADLVESLMGLADLTLSGQANQAGERLERDINLLAEAGNRSAFLTAWQAALPVVNSNLAMWTMLVLAIPRVSHGDIPGVHLATIVLAMLTSFEAFIPLAKSAQYMDEQLAAAERLFEIMTIPPAVELPEKPVRLPERFDLTLQRVNFTYPVQEGSSLEAGSLPALHDLSFDLPQGKRLAVVGPSGAGKSTLVNLLLRFWEYQSGEITLSGHSLRAYDPERIRAKIGVVSHHSHLFNASLADNLRLAQPGANREELEAAAKFAEIHDLIQALPLGYDTWTGEQGSRLSGGERQRLAIARAVLKKPPLLILDEATANLDPLTERRIVQRIFHMEWHNTMPPSLLWISHRLVEMDQMDEILVLEAGRVVERGKHRQLLAARGLYYQMWVLQNQALSG